METGLESQWCSAQNSEDLGVLVAVYNQLKGWYGEEEGVHSSRFQGIERGPIGRKRRVSRGRDFG